MAGAGTSFLDIDQILRQINQRKASGGYVPRSFIEDMLAANISTASQQSAQERSLGMQEQSLAEQLRTNRVGESERQREFDISQAANKEAQSKQGVQAIGSMITQTPMNLWLGKQAYDKFFPGKTQVAPGTAENAASTANIPDLTQTADVYQSPWAGGSGNPAQTALAQDITATGTPSAASGATTPVTQTPLFNADTSLAPSAITPATEATAVSPWANIGAGGLYAGLALGAKEIAKNQTPYGQDTGALWDIKNPNASETLQMNAREPVTRGLESGLLPLTPNDPNLAWTGFNKLQPPFVSDFNAKLSKETERLVDQLFSGFGLW